MNRKTAKRSELVVPGPEHLCAECGCNMESWRYAFAVAYRNLRLTYLGPDGHIRRFPSDGVWRLYEAALRELRARLTLLVANGVFRHRCDDEPT